VRTGMRLVVLVVLEFLNLWCVCECRMQTVSALKISIIYHGRTFHSLESLDLYIVL
jgi:hypothetical protein